MYIYIRVKLYIRVKFIKTNSHVANLPDICHFVVKTEIILIQKWIFINCKQSFEKLWNLRDIVIALISDLFCKFCSFGGKFFYSYTSSLFMPPPPLNINLNPSGLFIHHLFAKLCKFDSRRWLPQLGSWSSKFRACHK